MYASLFFPGVIIERHSFPKKVSSLTKYMFRLSGGVVVLTSFIKERLKTINVAEKKILVAPDGVDIKAFERPREKLNISGIEEGDFVYGYIGTLKTMGQEKGVADCLKALKELSKHYKLLIVGGEPADIEHYRKMSEYLEVASQVVFVGKVPHADIPAYTQMCDVLVAPFPESEHYSFFMSPLKIFEYMASKRPIISTTLPSIREVLTDGLNAVLISPSDPSALARAITIFHDKPVFAQSISEKAYRDVTEKYTWNIRAKNIINFLRSMVL
jgi:glycosyltransferase involved in cell wall biosynthesis